VGALRVDRGGEDEVKSDPYTYIIDVANARIPAKSVKKVNEITTRLGNDIIKKD
jgi:hypothetical protein